MNLQYQIHPSITPAGDILIETSLNSIDPFETKRELISRQLYQMQDQAVHDALVRLGWTPPVKLECGHRAGLTAAPPGMCDS